MTLLATDNLIDVIDITFSVPYDGAQTSVVVPSDISWNTLRLTIAETMVQPASKLKIAYRFSTDARTSELNHLSSSMHLMELMSQAQALLKEFEEKKTKGKGKSKVRPFKVEITDLDAKEKAKVKGRKSINEGKKVCFSYSSYTTCRLKNIPGKTPKNGAQR